MSEAVVSQELTLSFVPDAEPQLRRTLTRTRYQRTRDRVRLQNQLEPLHAHGCDEGHSWNRSEPPSAQVSANMRTLEAHQETINGHDQEQLKQLAQTATGLKDTSETFPQWVRIPIEDLRSCLVKRACRSRPGRLSSLFSQAAHIK